MKPDAPRQNDLQAPGLPEPSMQDGRSVAASPRAASRPIVADQRAIEATLRRSLLADAAAITIAIRGADVTLSGSVHSWDDRHRAGHAVRRVPGVRTVIDLMSLTR